MGGIGNQMFQYATGRRVAKINNIHLKLDTSSFVKEDKETTPRIFKLDHFNIDTEIATKQDIRYFKKFKKVHTKILGRIYNPLFANDSKYITEIGYGFNPGILNLKDDIYLDGYWQSEKYFKDIRDTLIKEFSLKTPGTAFEEQAQIITNHNAISIHIRRGDYVSNTSLAKNYGVCGLDYYMEAIELVTQKVENPHFFIFSDDISWAKENLKITYSHSYVSSEYIKDYEEIILMSKCKYNIIANSSFSWWGAWLNNNPNKIVIAPKKWFRDESWIPKDIIPETWLRI